MGTDSQLKSDVLAELKWDPERAVRDLPGVAVVLNQLVVEP